MAEIDIKKMEQSDIALEVLEVYKLLKGFKEDPDRIDWERDVYKRGWEVAFGKADSLWSKEEKEAMTKKGQIPIAINDIAKGIQGSSAVATANKPGITVKPIGSSDLYLAELVKRGFDFVWVQNSGQQLIYDVVKESKTGSLGVIDIKFNESKGKNGKIVLVSDNPLDYYFDKKSRMADKSDSPIIKAHSVTKKYAKDNYDVSDDDLDFKPIQKEETPGKSDEGNVRDGYVDASKSNDSGVKNKEEEEQTWEIEAWLLKTVKSYAVMAVDPNTGKLERFNCKDAKEKNEALEACKEAGIEAESKEFKSEKRVLRIIVGKKLISEEENPYGLDSDGDPVMPKIFIPHDRSESGFYTSPTYRGIEISRSRNKRRMQTIYVISKNIDAPIVASQGFKWETDDIHGDTLIVPKDSPFAPHRLLPGTTSGELMVMEQRDEQALNEEYDMNDVMKGKTPPGVEAYRAIASLQDSGAMMSMPFIGMLEGALEKSAKVIFSLMLRHWPREMWERLIDDDEKTSWQPPKQQEIDPENGEIVKPDPEDISMKWLKAIDMIKPEDPDAKPQIDLEGLDIRIMSGSTTPTNRTVKRVDAMDMVKAGIYPPEIALEYIDDPLKDKAAAIIKNNQKMMQQAQMMKSVKV